MVELAGGFLAGQILGHFEQPGDAGGVVVGAVVDVVAFVLLGQGAGTGLVAEVIDVGADDHSRLLAGRLGRGGQAGEDIAPGAALLIDVDGGGEARFGDGETGGHFAGIEFRLESLEVLSGGGDDLFGQFGADGDGGDARIGHGGIVFHGHELFIDLGVGAADEDDPGGEFAAGDHGFVAQARKALEFLPLGLGRIFREIAQDHDPFALHIEVEVARVGFAVAIGLGDFHAVSRKDDPARVDVAILRKGDRAPVFIGRQTFDFLPSEGEVEGIVLAHRDSGGEFEWLEPRAPVAGGFEAEFLEHRGDIGRGFDLAGRAREPALQFVRGEIVDVLLQVLDRDVGIGLGKIGAVRSAGGGLRGGRGALGLVEAQQTAGGGMIPVGEENLGLLGGGAIAGPGELFPIG